MCYYIRTLVTFIGSTPEPAWCLAETIHSQSPRSESLDYVKDTPAPPSNGQTPISKYAGPATRVEGEFDPSRAMQGDIQKQNSMLYIKMLRSYVEDLEAEVQDWRDLHKHELGSLVAIQRSLDAECHLLCEYSRTWAMLAEMIKVKSEMVV